MNGLYDFDDFLRRMTELDYDAIRYQAELEVASAERASFSVQGAPRQREMGSSQYASRIKAFLFYLSYWTRPGSVSDDEFACYRPIVEALIAKRQIKSEALDAFDR